MSDLVKELMELFTRVTEGECHCDPTDNYECDKHMAIRILEKAKLGAQEVQGK